MIVEEVFDVDVDGASPAAALEWASEACLYAAELLPPGEDARALEFRRRGFALRRASREAAQRDEIRDFVAKAPETVGGTIARWLAERALALRDRADRMAREVKR